MTFETKNNSSFKRVWEYVKANPGLTRELLIDILIKTEHHISSTLTYFVKIGTIVVKDNKYYTVGDVYMTNATFKKWINGTTKAPVSKTIPARNVLTDVKVDIKKQAVKTPPVDVERYIRCYVGTDNNLKTIIMDELPKKFPASTLWVVKTIFQKHTTTKNSTYWKVSDEVLKALEAKTGKKNIKFNGLYFIFS